MSSLHDLMDEKVDIYEENAKFAELLQNYYKDRNTTYLKAMWPIMFRASSNILKRRFGSIWKWERISNTAIDMVSLVLERIKNKEKYPSGYKILNLPRTLEYSILNVVYGPKAIKDDIEDRHADVDLFYDIQDTHSSLDEDVLIMLEDGSIKTYSREELIKMLEEQS